MGSFKHFKHKHVITNGADGGGHAEWDAARWEQFMKGRGLSSEPRNPVISVDHPDDVAQDFAPLLNIYQRRGRRDYVWLSINSRTIYDVKTNPFQVSKCLDARYEAGLEKKKDGTGLPIPGKPNHFERILCDDDDYIPIL